eukprot:gene6805-7574_t
MAVYFDYQIQSPSLAKHSIIACHPHFGLVAVASENEPKAGGAVTLYLDEGEHLEESTIQRSFECTAIKWHPSRKVLGIGWANGEVLIWNENDHEIHETSLHHRAPIKVIEWNSSGSKLASADVNGNISIWKTDQKGRLQQSPMYKHSVVSEITQVVFQHISPGEMSIDVAAAARAAVSGDESALDMFTWSKSNSKSKLNFGSSDSSQLFFGTGEGGVYQIDESGNCSEKFAVDGRVKALYYHQNRDVILTITESLLLTQHRMNAEGEAVELLKVKLSGQPSKCNLVWSGHGILASASAEQSVRVLNIETDENYALTLDGQYGFQSGESIHCLAYSPQKGILAGGTNLGRVAMWRYRIHPNDRHDERHEQQKTWELLPPCEVGYNAVDLKWGAGRGFLAVNCTSTVILLNEAIMNAHFNQQVGAVQISPSHLCVDFFNTSSVLDIKTDIHIKGVFVTKEHATIWNGKKVVVYEVTQNKSFVRAAGSFNSDSVTVAVHEQNIYLTEPGKVSVCTFQGTIKQELTFNDQEGDPLLLSICGSFMVVGTSKAVIKIFDLSRREARQQGPTKSVADHINGIGTLTAVNCNCNGTRVSILCHKNSGTADPCIYVWDVESDQIQSFNLNTGNNQVDLDEATLNAQESLTADIKGRLPKSIIWNQSEANLFACEAFSDNSYSKPEMQSKGISESIKKLEKNSRDIVKTSQIISFFYTPDNGIIVQDHYMMDPSHSGLLGMEIPYFYFVKKTLEMDSTQSSSAQNSSKHLIAKVTMRDFVGLESADNKAKEAMMKFSYLSSVGNMDEAFKAIKVIKSASVWKNMARMCVKTKRLDVAAVCLGNMGSARGAKALRESLKEPELDARVAMLAVQLGMLDEAERLYKDCKRYDLLNIFYQASNSWTKALEVAESYDRIHLRTTYYNYGKYLESVGNYAGAIQQFERSDTFRFEVPRMLFEDTAQLETYIFKSKDRPLRKWWAQYMESVGEMDTALQFYESAQDSLSLVRVNCFCGNIAKAAEICNETGDKSSCYHIARHFESQGDYKSAVHYFSRAQAYGNAIRIAKEHEMDNELMNLALLSSPLEMLEAARYLAEKPGFEDKAVMLYHKSGSVSKAIELAFQTQQFGALQLISEDLDERTDPDMLNKCAEFFIQHGQFDRAVTLLIIAKRFEEAIVMCMDNHVTINEDLAERMTLPKDHPDADYRIRILEKIADCAFKQGSYHLATKKFTQAGNKTKAMKALLKSGDTEKIVFFAGVSRQKEIYVMAANYLQSLDWRKDPEIMKNIIGFYTKGRAFDSLASFYEACAEVEVDEYQNYEKAYSAITEAYKCLSKAKMKNTEQQEERMANLKQKAMLIKKFVQGRKMYEENPEEAMKNLRILLDDPDVESGIRIGDVYGFMIEHYAKVQDFNQSYALMKELRQRIPSVNMAYYVSMRTIENIHNALDMPLGRGLGADSQDPAQDEEIVEEDYPDENSDEQNDDFI